MISYGMGPCAWVDCNEHCAVSKNLITGKLINLPTCEEHGNLVYQMRKLYKGFSSISEEYNNLYYGENNHQKLALLKKIDSSILSEIRGRMVLLQSVKPMYRDEGHSHYIQELLTNLEDVRKCIHNATRIR